MYRLILVPLDGSRLAEKILPQVKELAQHNGSEIALLRVARARTFPGVDPTDHQVQVVRRAEAYLKKIQADLEKEGFKASVHVRYGHPATEILDHASGKEVDLVAMSTHGRTGLSRWTLGSVAEKTIRHSSKPILLIRPADEIKD